MARIDLVDLAHSYAAGEAPEAFALKPISMTWRQGGAYALLGPSGCGKTTLLNLISGIVRPTRGKILFDGVDITPLSTQKRNIAQVFQFPVIYDTMTVRQNLAFPLKNRGVAQPEVAERVREVATMLELEPLLDRRGGGGGAGPAGGGAGRGLEAEDLGRARPRAQRHRRHPVR